MPLRPRRAAIPEPTANQRALGRAVAAKGGQLPLAKLIGTSQSNVWEWLNRSPRGCPAEWVLRVEAASNVPRHELRPDLYPPPGQISVGPIQPGAAA